MVHLDCPECGSSRTGQLLITDDQLDQLKRGPDGDIFGSGLPLYHCADCDKTFPLYVPKDIMDRKLDFDELSELVVSITKEMDPMRLRPWYVDLMFKAETNHHEGDKALALEYARLVLMGLTDDEGLEDAMDAMMDDGDIGGKLDLGRWLLETLSQFEVVPSGIWDVYSEAQVLHERGDDEAATALMDPLIRTADDHLIDRWAELRKYTRKQYGSNKRYLDKGSRKRVKELMNRANADMRIGPTLISRRALRLIREAHGIIGSV